MNLLNILLILISLIAPNMAAASPIVGYGSSDAVLPAKNQELFLMGFEVGFKKTLKDRSMTDVLVLDQTSDGSQLGAIGSAERLLAKGVSMLVGFPTSHEALLAAKIAKEKGVLSLFSAAGHSDLGKMGPTVFTTGESMNYSVNETLSFLRKKFPSKQGLLITNPYAVFSKNQEDVFIETLSKTESKDIHLKAVHLKKDLMLSDDDLESLKKQQFDYVVLTPYADESAKLLEQLEKNKIDIPLVANSSWTTGDVDFGRRFLTSRKSPAYVASLWMKGSKESRPFEKLIQQRYGRPATSEIAYGFDLGVIAATVLNSVKGTPTKESILKQFVAIKCFDGLSSGKICFNTGGGHAIRKITFLQFTTKGFVSL